MRPTALAELYPRTVPLVGMTARPKTSSATALRCLLDPAAPCSATTHLARVTPQSTDSGDHPARRLLHGRMISSACENTPGAKLTEQFVSSPISLSLFSVSLALSSPLPPPLALSRSLLSLSISVSVSLSRSICPPPPPLPFVLLLALPHPFSSRSSLLRSLPLFIGAMYRSTTLLYHMH